MSIYGAIFFCLSLILLIGLLFFNSDAYWDVTKEDSLTENSTFLLYVLAALLLLAIAVLGRGAPGRWLYLLGTLALVFATGEEISWGQRIFEFETPNALRELNRQGEFNLHNVEGINLNRVYRVGMMTLCVATSAAYFARKPSAFGVPLPSILLMYCFLLVYAWKEIDLVGLFPLSIFDRPHIFMLLFAAYAGFSRDRRLFTLSALFSAIIVLEQLTLNAAMSRNPMHLGEGREYLFSIACFTYAVEIFLANRAVVEKNVRAAYHAVSHARQ